MLLPVEVLSVKSKMSVISSSSESYAEEVLRACKRKIFFIKLTAGLISCTVMADDSIITSQSSGSRLKWSLVIKSLPILLLLVFIRPLTGIAFGTTYDKQVLGILNPEKMTSSKYN